MNEQYEAVRKVLEEKKDELSQRMSQIERDIRHEDKPLDSDFEEQAVERENDEVLDALGNTTRKELSDIAAALHRINNGEYGNCTACGEAISSERLDALPEAELCIGCAGKADA